LGSEKLTFSCIPNTAQTAHASIFWTKPKRYSNVVFFILVPGQPANLKATPLSGDKVLLSWDPPLYASSDIMQYVVVYNWSDGTPGSGTSQEMTVPAKNAGEPRATIENLKPNSNYSFHVVAVSSRGRGVPSVSVTTRTSPAGKANFILSRAQGAESVVLSFREWTILA
jgi:hypothetical protein